MTASPQRRPDPGAVPQPVPDPRAAEPADPVPGRRALRHDRYRRNEATGYGGSLQATNRDRILDHGNTFIVGGSIDVANYTFKSASTLGVINPDLSITTDPNNPTYGNIPGLGTGPIRTAGALGIAPSQVTGSNLYMGLYALDTFDVTDRCRSPRARG